MRNFLFLLSVFFISCSVSQKITYKTDDLITPSHEPSIPITVDVRILSDNRSQLEENKKLFTENRETKLNGKTFCINSEKFYKKDSVVTQITKLMTDHFNKIKLFSYALNNKSDYCDYYISGTLNSLYGEQEFSTGAAVGAQFGLIGALATSGIKTPGKIIIEIADLKLFSKDGTLIKDFGNFYKEYSEDISADAYCWCIYRNVNDKLKDFNSHLADKIKSDLTDIKFK
jgi:hypothetical protein